MKILLTTLIIIGSLVSYAQDTITIFYDSHWQRVYTKEEVEFTRKYLKEGKLWYVFDFYKNGQLQMEGQYKSRKFEKHIGDFTYYYKNGNVKGKKTYNKKGILIGSFKEFYSDGSPSGEGNYVDGKMNGLCNIYFKNGQQSAKVTFKDGEIVEEDYWNQDGYQLVGDEKKEANKMPSFPGGVAKMYEFLGNNITYPEQAKKQGASGRVIVNFIVNSDGSISDAFIINPINKYLDAEALRLVNIMPKWEAGVQYNRQVRVSYNLPIRFTL